MFRKLLFTLVCALFLVPAAALADGFIIPIPPPGIPSVPPLSIKYHHVDVVIQDQVAVTKVDQVFINHYERDLEGTYIFPIPEQASISKFSMYVSGERLEGRLLGRDEARRIYEDIVRRQQDPAILEYIGRDMFKARVYPIPGHGEKRIGLDYSEILKMDNGLCAYTYSLDTERFSRDPIQDVAINIELRSKSPIKTIYSPTHDISVSKLSDHRARITYVEEHSKPDRDLVLYYTVSEEEMGLNLLAYENGEGPGFFLAMISPQVDLDDLRVAKDIFFLLDTSGSMKGEKIQQAKDALAFCLQGLNTQDRFNLVSFSTDLKALSPKPLVAGPDEIKRALSFLDELRADGGTNIHDALQEALRQINTSPRPSMVIFLTDGLPTVGETDTGRILERIKKLNRGGARIFVFGVGYDVNTHFLDRLAAENGAVSEYVRPEESIEVKVSRFYGKVSTPVLTDLRLELDRMGVSEVYPRDLPDLFKGSQLIVLGRYRGNGSTVLTLRGQAGEVDKSYTYETDVRAKQQHAFIPRLWASRKIGYLLDQIRLNGHSQELVDEIVALSKEYGIMTEYTSFLIDLDVMVTEREMAEEAGRLMADAFEKKSGAGAVSRSMDLGALKHQATAPANVFRNEAGDKRQITGVKRIIDKTFYLKQGVWTDNDYQTDQRIVKVKRYSKAYFQLVSRLSSMGKYLSLGNQVIVSLPGGAVQVGDEGQEQLSAAELDRLI
ncbi:VIT domain-containing protein [Candidatus Zixiibacteriota bacterium]